MSATTIQINLLPASYRQRRERARLVTPIAMMVLISAAVVGVVWYGVKAEAQILTDRVTALENVPDTSASGSTATQSAAAINVPDATNRVAQLNSMSKAEINWNTAMDKAAKLIPQNIRLTSYAYSTATGITSLKLSGIAPSNVDFAVFMQSLRDDATLKDVMVNSYGYNPANANVAFAVTVDFPVTLLTYPTPGSTPAK